MRWGYAWVIYVYSFLGYIRYVEIERREVTRIPPETTVGADVYDMYFQKGVPA